jgi:hypothetical protein
MAPPDKALEEEIKNTVRNIFQSDERDSLSVNLVRKRVQEKFDLQDGFFLESRWKDRSKTLIKTLAVGAQKRWRDEETLPCYLKTPQTDP